ncbi:MAG: hypothetical protein AAF993_13240 [Pseudomonadota bacterium]
MNRSAGPGYIFHHIPKCGGSSINKVVQLWFEQIRDYRSGFNKDYANFIDIDTLSSDQCLCGHWELDGFYLHQRYPQAYNQDKFRVFSFVRDPLQTRQSLFRFEVKYNRNKGTSYRTHLLSRPNWLAQRFPVTIDNYQEFLNQYFFIGILERGQESLDTLAKMIGKPSVTLPRENVTIAGEEASLSDEFIEEFKEANRLDYAIYDYCLERFEDLLVQESD